MQQGGLQHFEIKGGKNVCENVQWWKFTKMSQSIMYSMLVLCSGECPPYILVRGATALLAPLMEPSLMQ